VITNPTDPAFEALLDYVRTARGFDFTGYKRPTLTRRVQKRVDDLKLPGFAEYRDYLELHSEEFDTLFDTILINVTSFFRDRGAWDLLVRDVVPRIIEKPGDEPIRIWCAGCASGEEAYTLAIVFAEAMGEEAFRARVKIYATDVDEEALSKARSGTYHVDQLNDVPAELRDRYFPGTNHDRSFRTDLRRTVIFGRNDITRDAPISRLDLVTCRNTLMYFNAETQGAVVRRLHYGLNRDGYLFLGRAEMLLSYGDLFTALNAPMRIYCKIGARKPRTIGGSFAEPARSEVAGDHEGAALHELAQQVMRVPQLIVDPRGVVVSINDAACISLDLAADDVGRPFQNLEISYRPIDLRTPIDTAASDGKPFELHAVERRRSDTESEFFDIVVAPLRRGSTLLGSAITFTDVTRSRNLQIELKRLSDELETAYEELQSANEELETTNEELQSTVEELETTNEELHSTNEELETTNEELRSTNDELDTTNDQLRQRTEEADAANAYLNSIVDGVSSAVVVVDDERMVRTWNVVAEEMWGLHADEVVGRSLFGLDSGLPVEQLRAGIDFGMRHPESVGDLVLGAMNRRGRAVRCRVKFTRLHSAERPGIVMLIEETTEQ
jgi:two-component system CheB/CheR fusion protein